MSKQMITAQEVLDTIAGLRTPRTALADAAADDATLDAGECDPERDVVPAYRLTSAEDVDQMVRSLGWDGGRQQFQEDFGDAGPLSGDAGPYEGWWAEGEWSDECPPESVRVEDLEQVIVAPIFIMTEQGVIVQGEATGWQDPDDADLVYVEAAVFTEAPPPSADAVDEDDAPDAPDEHAGDA